MPASSLKSFFLNSWGNSAPTVTFLEPGGDATFNVALTTAGGFYQFTNNTPTIATDFVHGSHIKSIQLNATDSILTPNGVLADAGSRASIYIYIATLGATTSTLFNLNTSGGASEIVRVRITSAGVLQLTDGANTQIGTNGATLSTGIWYRLSLAYTITSTIVNRFELFVDSVSSISVTNATILGTGTSTLYIGHADTADALDTRVSDIYVDNSASLTDTGNIWVTAKRPNANGTANNFTTQIGAGGSGYGTGHSPQVNERVLSTTNGWSMIGAGSAVTEEYSVEGAATGDIDISTATIVDWLAWIDTGALAGETGSIIAGGVSSTYTLTAAERLVTKVVGSSTYPAGGTDVGLITDTTLTTVSLYEAGVIVAYIPSSSPVVTTIRKIQNLLFMGVG